MYMNFYTLVGTCVLSYITADWLKPLYCAKLIHPFEPNTVYVYIYNFLMLWIPQTMGTVTFAETFLIGSQIFHSLISEKVPHFLVIDLK